MGSSATRLRSFPCVCREGAEPRDNPDPYRTVLVRVGADWPDGEPVYDPDDRGRGANWARWSRRQGIRTPGQSNHRALVYPRLLKAVWAVFHVRSDRCSHVRARFNIAACSSGSELSTAHKRHSAAARRCCSVLTATPVRPRAASRARFGAYARGPVGITVGVLMHELQPHNRRPVRRRGTPVRPRRRSNARGGAACSRLVAPVSWDGRGPRSCEPRQPRRACCWRLLKSLQPHPPVTRRRMGPVAPAAALILPWPRSALREALPTLRGHAWLPTRRHSRHYRAAQSIPFRPAHRRSAACGTGLCSRGPSRVWRVSSRACQ
jgi:hypothetical protein